MTKAREEQLKNKIKYLRKLLAITRDERDWYADLIEDNTNQGEKAEAALNAICARYEKLGKEPR